MTASYAKNFDRRFSSCERSRMNSSVRLADIHKRLPAYGTEGLREL
jgi:hypothetical protein